MCAIFGIIGDCNPELLRKISSVQKFRGPDDQNFFYDKNLNFCFGNNRLAVIDENSGKQPMYSFNKNLICVFNGTIFNHLELKDFLLKKGITFLTNSDTEVLVNSYSYWGDQAFNFFDGMWSTAIYDINKSEIILSRDYIGQKPLFYEVQKNKIIFSSQLNGIFQDKTSSRSIDYNSIQKFYFNSGISSTKTLFKNINQVSPGEMIKINLKNQKISKKVYWDLKNGPDFNTFFKKDIDLYKFFPDVIKNYSISDIQPESLLSSGIDSYLVTNFFNKIFENFQTYTLSFKEKSFNEADFVNKHFKNFNKNIINISDSDYKINLDIILKNIDHLCGDTSILPTYSIIKKTGSTKVVIGGDGGDEAFFGYIVFNALIYAKIFKRLPNFINSLLKNLIKLLPANRNYMSFSFKSKKFFSSINNNFQDLVPMWMSSLTFNEINKLFDTNNELDFFCNEHRFTKNTFRNAQLYFYKFYLPNLVLFKTDFSSMLNSKEYRSPLLSKNVINYSLNTDVSELYNFFHNKKIIQKKFNKDLPKKLFQNPKHGFAFPRHKILNEKNVYNFVRMDKLTNKKFFIKKLDNFVNNKEDCGQYLWNEIILTNVLTNLQS